MSLVFMTEEVTKTCLRSLSSSLQLQPEFLEDQDRLFIIGTVYFSYEAWGSKLPKPSYGKNWIWGYQSPQSTCTRICAREGLASESSEIRLKDLNDSQSQVDTSKEFAEETKLSEKATNKSKDDKSKKSSSSNSEKLELARQILLSFVVKSVQNNMDSSNGSSTVREKLEYADDSSEAIANDSAILKILYRNEGKDLGSQSSDAVQQKTVDVNKNKNGDGEGFIVVTKWRRNKQQFTNGVNGLYK